MATPEPARRAGSQSGAPRWRRGEARHGAAPGPGSHKNSSSISSKAASANARLTPSTASKLHMLLQTEGWRSNRRRQADGPRSSRLPHGNAAHPAPPPAPGVRGAAAVQGSARPKTPAPASGYSRPRRRGGRGEGKAPVPGRGAGSTTVIHSPAPLTLAPAPSPTRAASASSEQRLAQPPPQAAISGPDRLSPPRRRPPGARRHHFRFPLASREAASARHGGPRGNGGADGWFRGETACPWEPAGPTRDPLPLQARRARRAGSAVKGGLRQACAAAGTGFRPNARCARCGACCPPGPVTRLPPQRQRLLPPVACPAARPLAVPRRGAREPSAGAAGHGPAQAVPV